MNHIQYPTLWHSFVIGVCAAIFTLLLWLILPVVCNSAPIQCENGTLIAIPDRTHQKLFDMSVNMGVSRATKLLQQVLHVPVTGRFDRTTKDALCDRDEDTVLKGLVGEQRAFYQGICNRKATQCKFLRGWLRRADWIPE